MTVQLAARRAVVVLAAATLLSACQVSRSPITTANQVDLNRFMGRWYVIACIPTFIERDAYNAVEAYELAKDGSIETTFTFNQGAFDGPVRRYQPRGFVRDRTSNAVWGMQFVWPIKADYRIVHVSGDYRQTIVGREARDHVWIMARSPTIPGEEYAALLAIVEREGYDMSELR
ncbi:MAG: lipocalin family protein, partial [Steroidobacteraceae bacterium]